ncbi:hypothetical protein BgAZ_104520 [Babesia gibsoni]|uniref:Trafficking protein particle complex subunit n=1 Tax=Babesia gibsoni TaxID=33632 RepID=A0AAD8PFL9_BABGI|nr:hypothetical protein BgAZ_104520 [Babesia gibsoni]
MEVLCLFITNQHGSLIYYKSLNGRDAFSSNDAIRLASTLHGLSTIAPKLCVPKSSITDSLVPQPKGLKICMLCALDGPSKEHVNVMLNYVYELYADYVQKCPFHQPDMPVRSELFDEHISAYFKELTA